MPRVVAFPTAPGQRSRQTVTQNCQSAQSQRTPTASKAVAVAAAAEGVAWLEEQQGVAGVELGHQGWGYLTPVQTACTIDTHDASKRYAKKSKDHPLQ